MIITRISGGLGNQMFQYAFGRALSLKYGQQLKLDNWMQQYLHKKGFFNYLSVFRGYELDVFAVNASIADQSEIPLFLRCYKLGALMPVIDGVRRRFLIYKGREVGYKYDVCKMNIGPDVYLDGDWQSYKYFNDYVIEIKKDFTLTLKLSEHITMLGKKIRAETSVCLHVRRGDYVGNSFHGELNFSYYQKALATIDAKENIKKVYVFSDDIRWCKENLSFEYPLIFVDESYAGDRQTGHFWLMQQCHHFVIANSSFSWWTAWLADYKDKIVIAPKQWFSDKTINTDDLIPPEWIRI